MKIIYDTILDAEPLFPRRHIYEYKLVEVTACCDEMKQALAEKFIKFGEYDPVLNGDNEVNIFRCDPYPEGATWDEMAIRLCPFCGEKIEVEERKRFLLKKVPSKIPARVESKYVLEELKNEDRRGENKR
jgi:hypothetical protein